ncbi:MAG TPA: discoidin domain-containing protein, partial [Candidatus Eisenbacteria bacterium]
MMKYSIRLFFVIVLQWLAPTPAAAADRQVLDDFEDVSAWAPFPADGVSLKLSSDTGRIGKALRMDFGFTGGGYAVARRKLDLDLPENYAFTFDIKGDAPVNHLEFKLLDASGENVWWYVRRDMTFPADWTLLRTKKRQITFAWGPLPGELRHVAAVEIVVTAGTGGTGTLWVDDFALVTLPPPGATPPQPVAEASTEQPNAAAGLAVDSDSLSAWRPAELPAGLTIDYAVPREFGALTLTWGAVGVPSEYAVLGSMDGRSWTTLASVYHGNAGRDDFLLPESEWRYLRIDLPPPADPTSAPPLPSLLDVRLQPLEIGASREAFFGMLARAAP